MDAGARGSRRRERTRAQLLDAAEYLLSQGPPEEIRIEDVAARAGISPASVYVHFGTKDGLLAAVTERELGVATEVLNGADDFPRRTPRTCRRSSASPESALPTCGSYSTTQRWCAT